MTKVSMKDMLQAGVHFGHRTQYWNPKMAPYIFGARNSVHIINLEKTMTLFEEAMNFISKLGAKKSKILFVGTKRAAQKIIVEEATRCGMPYVNHRWLGGMLTNYKTIRQSIRRLKELSETLHSDKIQQLKKKEVLTLQRNHDKLEKSIGGIQKMGGLPDALFVVDANYEDIAITEARCLKIPVIAIVDTNTNPDNLDYLIPGNDDSIGAIQLYAKAVADAILEARAHLGDDYVEVGEESSVDVPKGGAKAKPKAVTRKKAVVSAPEKKAPLKSQAPKEEKPVAEKKATKAKPAAEKNEAKPAIKKAVKPATEKKAATTAAKKKETQSATEKPEETVEAKKTVPKVSKKDEAEK
jgi:small subunit ribosomal protein S2